MYDNNANGCGACKGFWAWLKPPKHKLFDVICNVHDYAYNYGGTEADRLKADKWLFKKMITKIEEMYLEHPYNYMKYTTLAYLYYIAVRNFGKTSFNYKKL